jgi:hypothetical protein
MPYIQRDVNNKIIGIYANKQDGYAEEFLDEDSNELNPPETPEQIIARLECALDKQLDEVAKEYRYESIRTMVTYATSEHPTFGNEGRGAVAYRDAVYAYGIQCISDVQAELRPIPTEAELIAELPPFADFLE